MSTTQPDPTSNHAEIVKVQLPLFAMDSRDAALIYGKGRSHLCQNCVSRDIIRRMGGRTKGYFYAVWHGPQLGWEIGQSAPDQNW